MPGKVRRPTLTPFGVIPLQGQESPDTKLIQVVVGWLPTTNASKLVRKPSRTSFMKKLKYLLGAATLLLSLSTLAGEPVDLNSANAKALATAIDGVGMKRAEAIVNYRNQHGPFESVDDLAKVRGISTKTINKNRENLSVNLSDG